MRREHKCPKCGYVQKTAAAPGRLVWCTKCNNPDIVTAEDPVVKEWGDPILD